MTDPMFALSPAAAVIRPLRGRATFAVIGLVLAGLHGVATAVLFLTRSGYQPDTRIDVGVLAFAGLSFISWLFEARTNLDGVEPRLRWHPLWSFAGWLVPVVSLVIPLLVVKEVDSATQRLNHESARPGLFAAWACSWTILQIITVAAGGGLVLVVTAGIMQAVAAVSAVLLVLRITAEQERAAAPYLVASAVRPPRRGGLAR